MAINLTTKYASTIEKLYTHTSFLRAHCKANVEMTGAKTCRVYMLNTTPVVDYTRNGTSRYGEVKDVQDTVVEYMMTQDKSFTGVVDKGDESEQAISNKSGQWLRQQIAEQCVPTGDKYGFARIAKLGHIARRNPQSRPRAPLLPWSTTRQPTWTSTSYRKTAAYCLYALRIPKIILSDEWTAGFAGGKQLRPAPVGQIAGFTVVKVPSNMFPTDVYMVAAQESALAFPYRINDTKIHQDPPGISVR